MHLQLFRIYPLQHHQPTLLVPQQVMLNDLDETSVSDNNSDNGDDDYDTTDVLESFNSSEVKCVQPILHLMEQNADVLTWNKKT